MGVDVEDPTTEGTNRACDTVTIMFLVDAHALPPNLLVVEF